ncbi:MarR family transcriptional regulator [Flavobacterium sp. WW92]|uniref:MarR family winged helix-turn-helix transcriptional regulator n=1 Tax=unclassified Flavobacterium TaxID=196869 RepID=UPI002225ABFF|nr:MULTISPECIES: MarR family transcriptional regulator [unclassified Flavobacterium]WDO13772.1 MarR family transcriptional regulator [Flavobacterium sp. WW92]
MEKLKDITFYTMDKAIRTYRIFAQKRLRDNGYKITIDQWLIIKAILENPGISQQEIGEKVFKDNASVTRIIELLVKSEYLEREVNQNDRRKSNLKVTVEGKRIIEKVHDLVLENRKTALAGILPEELEILNKTLKKIISNCN